eukprot:CAMPEP_0174739424 /NCGR_PEP_ID=MMETSP1094-20130205/71603_1 /TAXON_ID=156173 /ORGANISM="Chrysochromulina brevifilum, Strain UTEX LB 985" /LENGTH=76 /DNA_ID=CAMNT_0015942987 /DNA_START=262 /DNA_END=490 /DNA_ORIENTATION=+
MKDAETPQELPLTNTTTDGPTLRMGSRPNVFCAAARQQVLQLPHDAKEALEGFLVEVSMDGEAQKCLTLRCKRRAE